MMRRPRIIRLSRLALPALLVSLAACGCRSAGRQVRIIAFGDSTTAGPEERDYPEILEGRLRLPPGAVANEGRSGESSGDGLVRLRRLNLKPA